MSHLRVLFALLVLLVSGCHKAASQETGGVRIVSVGGSVTEIVYALGCGSLVVGVDTSSTFPEEAFARPKVGYQRMLSAEGVIGLRPSLVLVTAETGPAAAIEQIKGAGIKVVTIPAENSREGIRAKIAAVGEAVGKSGEAKALADKTEIDLDGAIAEAKKGAKQLRVKALFLYARGAGTVMVSGTKTPGAAILELAGVENAVSQFEGFKPISAEAVTVAAPDVLVVPAHGLSSLGGIDGLTALPGIALTKAGRDKHVIAIDDLLLLGFGPRTGEAVRTLSAELQKLP